MIQLNSDDIPIDVKKKPTKAQMKRIMLYFNNVFAYHIMGIVQREFMKKARGRTDNLGLQWKKLNEKYAAWKKRHGYTLNGKTVINIKTGVLDTTLSQGEFSRSRYKPPEGQNVEIDENGIDITFEGEYIEYIQLVRPLIPDDITEWQEEAFQLATKDLKKYVKEMGL